MNKFVKNSLNISATLAIILAILSFVVPFLLGGFIIVGLGLLLGTSAIFGEKKTLGIVSISLCIVSLIISPTFWLYLGGLSLSSKSTVSRMNQVQIQTPAETTTQDASTPTKEQKEPTKEELEDSLNNLLKPQTPITKKIFPYAIVKQDDGSYNYYPSIYRMSLKENITKAFAQKNIDIDTVKVNVKSIDERVVLETNAIEQSKNPDRLKEFFGLYKDQKLKIFVDDNLVVNAEYPITPETMGQYKDIIIEMSQYSGFYPKLITQ